MAFAPPNGPQSSDCGMVYPKCGRFWCFATILDGFSPIRAIRGTQVAMGWGEDLQGLCALSPTGEEG